MKNNNTKKNTQTTYETAKKIRGDWGNVNPVTKVIPDKRKKKPKYKDNYEES